MTALEILEVNAEAFCRMSSMLGQMLVRLENSQLNQENAGVMAQSLGELLRESKRLGLRHTTQQLERIKEHYLSNRSNASTLQPMIFQLYERILDELSDRHFLALKPEAIPYYRQARPLFGDTVENKFTSMNEDISEAGKCLALGRYTASVFHLMRVMEIATQQFGDKVGVQLVSEKVWQVILDGINKAIKAMDQKAPQTKAYAAASSHLYNVKLAWRNEVMHPKQTYSEEEATNLFSQVSIFIRDLAVMI